MRFFNISATVFSVLVLLLGATGAKAAGAREEGILLEAAQVMEELRATPDKGIPDALLQRAYGIAIFPGLIKGAFFFGGRHGDGVFIQRDKAGHFTSPYFISLTGGSFGLQFGAQKEDIVLVFTTRNGVEGVTGGKLTLGGDISVAVGPVGREASASTDFSLAQVYSYSRAKGLFGGVAADGTVITVDEKSNEYFYKKPGVLASEIAQGAVKAHYQSTRRFMRAINVDSGEHRTAAQPAAPPQPAVQPPQPQPAQPPQPPQPAQPAQPPHP